MHSGCFDCSCIGRTTKYFTTWSRTEDRFSEPKLKRESNGRRNKCRKIIGNVCVCMCISFNPAKITTKANVKTPHSDALSAVRSVYMGILFGFIFRFPFCYAFSLDFVLVSLFLFGFIICLCRFLSSSLSLLHSFHGFLFFSLLSHPVALPLLFSSHSVSAVCICFAQAPVERAIWRFSCKLAGRDLCFPYFDWTIWCVICKYTECSVIISSIAGYCICLHMSVLQCIRQQANTYHPFLVQTQEISSQYAGITLLLC